MIDKYKCDCIRVHRVSGFLVTASLVTTGFIKYKMVLLRSKALFYNALNQFWQHKMLNVQQQISS